MAFTVDFLFGFAVLALGEPYLVGAESCSAISFRCYLGTCIISEAFFCIVLVFSIYDFDLFRHCGTRTAGEVLFCYSPKEYPEKAVPVRLPRKNIRGT